MQIMTIDEDRDSSIQWVQSSFNQFKFDMRSIHR